MLLKKRNPAINAVNIRSGINVPPATDRAHIFENRHRLIRSLCNKRPDRLAGFPGKPGEIKTCGFLRLKMILNIGLVLRK